MLVGKAYKLKLNSVDYSMLNKTAIPQYLSEIQKVPCSFKIYPSLNLHS